MGGNGTDGTNENNEKIGTNETKTIGTNENNGMIGTNETKMIGTDEIIEADGLKMARANKTRMAGANESKMIGTNATNGINGTGEVLSANRKYKDSVFRLLFKEKKELLGLFNMIHGTDYGSPEELEVTTLENAVYMARKNDLSCVLDMRLDLYEHQSTVNPNMPLRDLIYIAKLLEKRIGNKDIYSSRRIELPTPLFITFYNGAKEQPEKRTFRLSDSYARNDGDACLELIVQQININYGHNRELVSGCRTLYEYTQYVDRVRRYEKKMPINEAVELAVDECIREGILREFLIKNREEVIPLSIFEYDQEKHDETLRREGYEDGKEDGREEGREKGIKEGREKSAVQMLKDNLPIAKIVLYTSLPESRIAELQRGLSGK